MRWWACGLLIAMASPALAADYDDSWLRGSQTIGPAPTAPPRLYRIWAGVYGGVQVGEDFHGVSYTNLAGPLVAITTRQDSILNVLSGALGGMTTLPHESSNGPSYGGFLGYNWQIDDVVFGAELNANRASLNSAAYNYVNRGYIVTVPPNNNIYDVNVKATTYGTATMSDYGTVRGRLGWAFGNFLPYLVAGVSFAQIDSTRVLDINYSGTCLSGCGGPVAVGAGYPYFDSTHGKYIIGFDAALGLDYMLTPNVFTRGEVEYLQLGWPNNISVNTVSARVAIGLKY